MGSQARPLFGPPGLPQRWPPNPLCTTLKSLTRLFWQPIAYSTVKFSYPRWGTAEPTAADLLIEACRLKASYIPCAAPVVTEAPDGYTVRSTDKKVRWCSILLTLTLLLVTCFLTTMIGIKLVQRYNYIVAEHLARGGDSACYVGCLHAESRFDGSSFSWYLSITQTLHVCHICLH